MLNFKNHLVRNALGQIKYQHFTYGGRPHYHIKLWLAESPEMLNQIERIEYRLHSTAHNPFQVSYERSEKFEISFWTWSMFPIHIRAFCQDGTLKRHVHVLKYHLPSDTGFNYIEVNKKTMEIQTG